MRSFRVTNMNCEPKCTIDGLMLEPVNGFPYILKSLLDIISPSHSISTFLS